MSRYVFLGAQNIEQGVFIVHDYTTDTRMFVSRDWLLSKYAEGEVTNLPEEIFPQIKKAPQQENIQIPETEKKTTVAFTNIQAEKEEAIPVKAFYKPPIEEIKEEKLIGKTFSWKTNIMGSAIPQYTYYKTIISGNVTERIPISYKEYFQLQTSKQLIDTSRIQAEMTMQKSFLPAMSYYLLNPYAMIDVGIQSSLAVLSKEVNLKDVQKIQKEEATTWVRNLQTTGLTGLGTSVAFGGLQYASLTLPYAKIGSSLGKSLSPAIRQTFKVGGLGIGTAMTGYGASEVIVGLQKIPTEEKELGIKKVSSGVIVGSSGALLTRAIYNIPKIPTPSYQEIRAFGIKKESAVDIMKPIPKSSEIFIRDTGTKIIDVPEIKISGQIPSNTLKNVMKYGKEIYRSEDIRIIQKKISTDITEYVRIGLKPSEITQPFKNTDFMGVRKSKMLDIGGMRAQDLRITTFPVETPKEQFKLLSMPKPTSKGTTRLTPQLLERPQIKFKNIGKEMEIPKEMPIRIAPTINRIFMPIGLSGQIQQPKTSFSLEYMPIKIPIFENIQRTFPYQTTIPYQSQISKQGLIQQEDFNPNIPIPPTAEIIKEKPFMPPFIPLPAINPLIDVGGFGLGKARKGKGKTRYMPSLTAKMFGIYGKGKPKKWFSGFEIRPMF